MNRMAEKIMKARLKAKLSEKQLAKKCGLTASYIIQIESGKKIINEDVAEKILKSLGEEIEYIIPEDIKEEPVIKKVVVVKQESYSIEPNSLWSNALEGVIKKYSINDLNTNKVVGYKELPILGKKVIGYNSDKLIFVKNNENLYDYRIQKDDVVMVLMESDIKNDNLYLLEVNNKKIIRKIRKESNNNIVISKDKTEDGKQIMKTDDLKVIGRCIKVEFDLI